MPLSRSYMLRDTMNNSENCLKRSRGVRNLSSASVLAIVGSQRIGSVQWASIEAMEIRYVKSNSREERQDSHGAQASVKTNC